MKVYENASIVMVRLNTTFVLQITQLLPTAPQEEENVKAISLLSDVIIRADSIDDNGERLEHLLKGIFAGNIFDLGVTQVAIFEFVNPRK